MQKESWREFLGRQERQAQLQGHGNIYISLSLSLSLSLSVLVQKCVCAQNHNTSLGEKAIESYVIIHNCKNVPLGIVNPCSRHINLYISMFYKYLLGHGPGNASLYPMRTDAGLPVLIYTIA